MTGTRWQASTELVADILSLLAERSALERVDALEAFVIQYYGNVAVEDVEHADLSDWYGAALSHWNFARQRRPGETRLRVFNPHTQTHGWQSTHSVLEIVCDDRPFLLDSVRMAIERCGHSVHLIIHPVMGVVRDERGIITDIAPLAQSGTATMPAADLHAEAVMHLELDRQSDEALGELETAVSAVLGDVIAAVDDWPQMIARIDAVMSDHACSPPAIAAAELDESNEFLAWLRNDHFTFLGYRAYDLVEAGADGPSQAAGDRPGADTQGVGRSALLPVPGSGLGLLRERDGHAPRVHTTLTPEALRIAQAPELLIITKSNHRSTVHRPSYLDYIGIKRFDAQGKVLGEHRFVGLFTSAAYNRSPLNIPLLANKLKRVLARSSFAPRGHAEKALLNILETFPRDQLFQLDEDQLYQTALGILHLEERRRPRIFIHRERFGRFYSCLVYVPRERFNTSMRVQIQDLLQGAFGASGSEFSVALSESVLARIHFVLHVEREPPQPLDHAAIEARLRELSRSWSDDLSSNILEYFGEARGVTLVRRYCDAFRADYREHYSPRVAVHDIEQMEALEYDERGLGIAVFRPLEALPDQLRLKLFHLVNPVHLSDALPMLENMGLQVEEEHPTKIKRADGPRVWIHDFGMRSANGSEVALERIRGKFHDAFAQVWAGAVENDGFNRLVIGVGLDWREVVVLRAYYRYLRQIRLPFSQAYVERALSNNPNIARALLELFQTRFDPALAGDRDELQRAIIERISAALIDVSSLDEDRILHAYLALVRASTRTNFYQRDVTGMPKSYLSLKFDPSKIPDMPRPRPMFEIFVYSPRVEGVHLRGGPVARGGLRWSDRAEDFRTEVLGLMKAQMVKNAVIVPVGSKGGFYVKQAPASGEREALLAEGVACYKTFIQGMLDLTDNLVAGEVVPPPEVVRFDADDPYLVVAADKGTATFSDHANAVAAQYGFWLGDAFASGGSVGYDHKGMGITARGAWESVQRHFRELGVDIQRQPFSVVGIGDMSGDVFGNGMLLSPQIRLLFAFNHLHIFMDPDPDPATALAERKRLFELPRSSWADYDSACISSGGGVFARSAKSIPISAQMRQVLGLSDAQLTPSELIRAALRAPVDLVWNGGIGTYVKASTERNEDVGDRANDAVRVDSSELRCRVVGEGGNLGCTQLGRIEFAARGGRINTDAIDNSAGVDCSDHEVNIKVLLNQVVEAGDMTEKQRRALLSQMTDDVSRLVLRNNYLQTQALSMACAQSESMLDVHTRLMRELEKQGALERAIEYLPAEDEIIERKACGRGLTAPELAVLMAYVKIELFKALQQSRIGDQPALTGTLVDYFPKALQTHYSDIMPGHRLANEIVSTLVANSMVNRSGITFWHRITEETGARPLEIAHAYFAASAILDLGSMYASVEALDNVAPAAVQTRMLLDTRRLAERAVRWLLRNRPRPLDIQATIGGLRAGVLEVGELLCEQLAALSKAGDGDRDGEGATLVEQGVPENLALRVQCLEPLYSAFDIVEAAAEADEPIAAATHVYFAIGSALGLVWLHEQVNGLPRSNRWQTLARNSLRDDLYAQERLLALDVLKLDCDGGIDVRLRQWLGYNEAGIARCRAMLADIQTSGTPDFAMLSVVIRELRSLRLM